MNKDKYIEIAKERFNGKALDIVLKQINLFYENIEISKNKYVVGNDVFLEKGTFIHGIFGGLDNFDYTVQNGFISVDFTDVPRANKIMNSVGMWNIQDNCLLKDYINLYSGFTISYLLGRGPGAKKVSELVPYHKFDEFTERINNDEEVWSYSGEQTKEVRFIPSLVSDKRQIAFILNMKSDYARELAKADVWNLDYDEEMLIPFIDTRYYSNFLEDRKNRTVLTTNRESQIMFGLPISLVEGILVGRKFENDESVLNYIKSKLPDCYICNLDGKVVVGN
ncbi:MAG: hypothetical protein IJ475_00775 [Bacilli bacterium]|nr:hypothetical protein [Bacilli bacterium]